MAEEFESRIGKGTQGLGQAYLSRPGEIEGEAEGEITGDEVVIATGAVVSARISASKVTIAGAFSGEVTARERVESDGDGSRAMQHQHAKPGAERRRAVRRRLQDADEEAGGVNGNCEARRRARGVHLI